MPLISISINPYAVSAHIMVHHPCSTREWTGINS